MANVTDRVVTKRTCEAKPTDVISSALVLLQYLILANGFSALEAWKNCKDLNGVENNIGNTCDINGSKMMIHKIFGCVSFNITVNVSAEIIVVQNNETELTEALKHNSGILKKSFSSFFKLREGYDIEESYVGRLSPFHTYYIGLRDRGESNLSWRIQINETLPDNLLCGTHKAQVYCLPPLKCVQRFDRRLFAFFTLGVILVFTAKTLSRHVMFYYVSGLSVGVFLSWLLILFILLKLLPYKKSILASVVVGGSSIGLAITNWMYYNVEYLFYKYTNLVIGYFSVVVPADVFRSLLGKSNTERRVTVSAGISREGFITFAALYYMGPPTNVRALDLIQWFLQLLGLTLIYNSTYAREVAVTFVVLAASTYAIGQYIDLVLATKSFIFYCLPFKWKYKIRPPKFKFLSEEEYREQSTCETAKALKELREYCSSPECDTWRLVSRLKNPKKFSDFVKDGSQFGEDELKAYDKFETDTENWYSSDEDDTGNEANEISEKLKLSGSSLISDDER